MCQTLKNIKYFLSTLRRFRVHVMYTLKCLPWETPYHIPKKHTKPFKNSNSYVVIFVNIINLFVLVYIPISIPPYTAVIKHGETSTKNPLRICLLLGQYHGGTHLFHRRQMFCIITSTMLNCIFRYLFWMSTGNYCS